ncbi:hypothetical protein D3C85_683500 [compost metagenome]
MPAEAKVSLLPGARALRIRSSTLWMLEPGGTTRMLGVDATMPMGIRSRSQS